MARRLRTNKEIDEFILKVTGEANHHAQNVASVIAPLEQAVRAKLNLAVDSVEVMERNGVLGRTCWIVIAGSRWVFSYNYQTSKIELRRGSTRGSVHFQFDNSTGATVIAAQVAKL